MSKLGWALMRYVFVPLVLLALVVGLAAQCACIKGTAKVAAPEPPVLLVQKLQRTVQVFTNCGPDGSWTGSGVILEATRWGKFYVATADHVYGTAECSHLVRTSSGLTIGVGNAATDEDHDVTVLSGNSSFEFSRLENAWAKVGDPVITSGYPHDRYYGKTNLSVSYGHIVTEYKDRRYQFRIDAVINSGNSGGPAWSPDGHLVGLTNAMWMDYNSGAPFDGHYYVTDAKYVFKLFNKLSPPPDDHPNF